jgi:quercetin dioxygenase-like cupin family protein
MKRHAKLVLVCFGLILSLATYLSFGSNPEDLDPLKVAPETHKLVFENALVRVIEAKVPPGAIEPKHSHPHGVTVYLADFDSEIKTFPDGKVTEAHRKFGSVFWSEAIVHEVRNTGTTPAHALRIELKN